MNSRRRFQPELCLALEDRVVLSRFVGPVGTLGDSLTDEYQFYTPDRYDARNWVEILHALRGVSFGAFTTAFRPEPRDQGFADNWARSGATSTDMVANQLPGLTAQVAAGQVKYASIFIGGDDYLDLLEAVSAGTLAPANVPAALAATTETLERNVRTATDTLLAANPNVKIALWTLPAGSDTPLAHEIEETIPGSSALIEGIDQAELSYNAMITSLAASNSRVALVNLAAVTAQLESSPTGTFSFGGVTVNLNTPGENFHDYFLGDGLHSGTIAQGIYADTFAEAIDQKFGADLIPISPRAIVRYAAKVEILNAHPHTKLVLG